MGKPGQSRVEQLNRLESAKEILTIFVTQDLSGSELELCRPTIRQLAVWARCYKRNWGKMTPLASGVSSANCQFGEDATNGIGGTDSR